MTELGYSLIAIALVVALIRFVVFPMIVKESEPPPSSLPAIYTEEVLRLVLPLGRTFDDPEGEAMRATTRLVSRLPYWLLEGIEVTIEKQSQIVRDFNRAPPRYDEYIAECKRLVVEACNVKLLNY